MIAWGMRSQEEGEHSRRLSQHMRTSQGFTHDMGITTPHCAQHDSPEARGRRSIIKDVAQVGARDSRHHLSAHHAKATILFSDNMLRINGLVETEAASTGCELAWSWMA